MDAGGNSSRSFQSKSIKAAPFIPSEAESSTSPGGQFLSINADSSRSLAKGRGSRNRGLTRVPGSGRAQGGQGPRQMLPAHDAGRMDMASVHPHGGPPFSPGPGPRGPPPPRPFSPGVGAPPLSSAHALSGHSRLPQYSPPAIPPHVQQQLQSMPDPATHGMIRPGLAHLSKRFVSEALRQELILNSGRKLAQVGPGQNAQLGLPDMLCEYHTLFPLEGVEAAQTRSPALGVCSLVAKGISAKSGEACAVRRVHPASLSPTRDHLHAGQRALQRWHALSLHPNFAALRDVFVSDDVSGTSCLFFAHDYVPGATTAAALHLRPQQSPSSGLMVMNVPSEAQLWSYATQLISGCRVAHAAGLVLGAVAFHPSKVLVSPAYGRIRYSAAGVEEVLRAPAYAASLGEQLGPSQAADLGHLGSLLMSLACAACPGAAPNVEYVAAHFSGDLTQLLTRLLASPRDGMTWPALHALLGDVLIGQVDAAHATNDTLMRELGQEMDNGRMLRLLAKIDFICERPSLQRDVNWAETGDRYMVKLFRDFVFHQVNEQGAPLVSWGHMVEALYKLDIGSPERIMLMGRNELDMIIASFGEIKECLDSSYKELMVLKRKFIVPLNAQLAGLTSFEAAIVTFGPVNGTARSEQYCSPWTEDLQVLNTWIDALPQLAEGGGTVAAFQAVAEAWAMLKEPPQRARPSNMPVHLEALMLWLSDPQPLHNVLLRAPSPSQPSVSPDELLCQILVDKRIAVVVCVPGTPLPFSYGPALLIHKAVQRCIQQGADRSVFSNYSALISVFPNLRACSNGTARTSKSAVLTSVVTSIAAANAADSDFVAVARTHGRSKRKEPRAALPGTATPPAAAPPAAAPVATYGGGGPDAASRQGPDVPIWTGVVALTRAPERDGAARGAALPQIELTLAVSAAHTASAAVLSNAPALMQGIVAHHKDLRIEDTLLRRIEFPVHANMRAGMVQTLKGVVPHMVIKVPKPTSALVVLKFDPVLVQYVGGFVGSQHMRSSSQPAAPAGRTA